MTDVVAVNGRCEPRFAGVADAFAENFRSRGEAGAAVAVTLNGEPVIDLWGGFADSARTRPWAEDTLVCMMSVAKAVTALLRRDGGGPGPDRLGRARWRATGPNSPLRARAVSRSGGSSTTAPASRRLRGAPAGERGLRLGLG